MQPPAFAREPGLDALRRLRVEMFDSMSAVQKALAAPATGREREWCIRVDAALTQLQVDLREHVTTTEAPGGMHQDVVTTEPRLAHAVERLGREHVQLTRGLDALLAECTGDGGTAYVEAIRERTTALLAQLARHRQRGADLIYEAYSADIGGET